MEAEITKQNIAILTKQRNFFLGFSVIVLICCLILSVRVASDNRQVILVPGLSRDMGFSDSGVSVEVLEEMTTMILPLLLDLDHDSIDWKKRKVLDYISTLDPKYMEEIIAYYTNLKDRYKTFELSTRFGVKQYKADSKNLQVMASGLLRSHFGLEGYETQTASYLLSYDWVGGKLLLKEFKLVDEKKLKEEKENNYEEE